MLVAAPGLLGGRVAAPADDPWDAPDLPADEIVLVDGRRVEGRLLFEAEDELIVRIGTRTRRYERSEVDSLVALRDRLETGLTLIDSLPGRRRGPTPVYGRVGLHVDVAERLADLGLAREARLVHWRILDLDADHERAHAGIGSKRSGRRWLVPFGGRYFTLDEARSRSRHWGEAWEFDTSHYHLRTNLPLADCVRTAFDLERVYRAVYAMFGESLGLYEIAEPLAVSVHADSRSYPEVSGHLGGYFSKAENHLHLDASRGLDRRVLAHEVTHQLIFNSARATKKRDGGLPDWLDEGLAQYVQASIAPVGEGLECQPGSEEPSWLAVHAEAREPFSLRRVLNLTTADFQAGESRLKYAQAWTLVQFCLHGRDGVYRAPLLDFVRGCQRGQSSTTHFERAFGGRSDELEQEWTAWVRERAGR